MSKKVIKDLSKLDYLTLYTGGSVRLSALLVKNNNLESKEWITPRLSKSGKTIILEFNNPNNTCYARSLNYHKTNGHGMSFSLSGFLRRVGISNYSINRKYLVKKKGNSLSFKLDQPLAILNNI